MKQNLDTLSEDIQRFLDENQFVVFHGYSRVLDTTPIVTWDVRRFPDFRGFLDVARKLDLKLITFHQQQFSADLIDEAVENLENAELMSRDDRRTVERRLRDLRMYDGFTCTIELAFDHGDHLYLFVLQTEWYDEVHEILDEIDAATPDDDEDDEDDGSMGGYYSRN